MATNPEKFPWGLGPSTHPRRVAERCEPQRLHRPYQGYQSLIRQPAGLAAPHKGSSATAAEGLRCGTSPRSLPLVRSVAACLQLQCKLRSPPPMCQFLQPLHGLMLVRPTREARVVPRAEVSGCSPHMPDKAPPLPRLAAARAVPLTRGCAPGAPGIAAAQHLAPPYRSSGSATPR